MVTVTTMKHGAAVAGLVLGSCAAPTPVVTSEPPGAVSHEPPPPPPVATAPLTAPDPPPPAEPVTAHVRFVVERAETGEGRAFVVVPELGVKQPVGVVAAAHRCEVNTGSPLRRPGPVAELVCWQSVRAVVSVADGRLSILPSGGKVLETAIPARAEIVSEIVDGARPVCAEGVKPKAIEVRAAQEWKTGADGRERSMHLSIPAIDLERALFMSPRAYCHGRPRGSREFDLSCSGSESSSGVSLVVRDGVLWMVERQSGYDLPTGLAHIARGGFALPCGGRMRFPRVHVADASWSPPGNTPACATASDRCEDRCADAQGDREDDEAVTAAIACSGRCNDKSLACMSPGRGGK